MLLRTQIAQLNNSHCSLFLNNLEMWTNALHFFQWQISMSTDGWQCSLTSSVFSWSYMHWFSWYLLSPQLDRIAQCRRSIMHRVRWTQRLFQTPDIVIKSKYLNHSINGPHWCDSKSFNFLICEMKRIFFILWYGQAINASTKQIMWP